MHSVRRRRLHQVEEILSRYLDIGIIDTMKDLLVNLVGALSFSLLGYFYEKGQRKRMPDLIIHKRGIPEAEDAPEH